ncbi:MAG: hypothetical protein H0U16_04560 [Actinobacteria bacterium]|nr:hypothetical protein [Actinomycetota bacterium]
MGDHRWWISDLREFERDFPDWRLEYDVGDMLLEIYEENSERWSAGRR